LDSTGAVEEIYHGIHDSDRHHQLADDWMGFEFVVE